MDAAPLPPPSGRSNLRYAAACTLIVALAAAARLATCFDGLWYDEIFSVMLGAGAHAASEIFTEIAVDNNHFLNTLMIYLLGDQERWFVYRLPLLCAGVATVALAGYTARRRGRTATLLALALTGGSYFMVLFSSEVRGYAYAMLFAVAALEFLEAYLEQPGWRPAIGFWATAILGLLGQASYLHVLGGMQMWTLVRMARVERRAWPVARHWLKLHAAPAGFFALLYLVNLRHIWIGGGPITSPVEAGVGALALTVGILPGGVRGTVAAAAALALLIAGLVRLMRARDDRWVLYFGGLLLVPAVVVVAARIPFHSERYFSTCFPLYLLLAAETGAAAWTGSRAARGGCLLGLALILGANGFLIADQIRAGRGDYLGAIRYMAERTPDPVITVCSDHDYRNGMLVTFYRRYVYPAKEVQYLERAQVPAEGTEWYIAHGLGPGQPAVPLLVDRRGHTYRFERRFPHAGMSGWTWDVYRREAGGGGEGPAAGGS
ncbi:MAG: hypothetical protein HZA54_19015 [Planctomycetes bacterium]|nr:hypothetical protein [Planctomycetota bacterium]